MIPYTLRAVLVLILLPSISFAQEPSQPDAGAIPEGAGLNLGARGVGLSLGNSAKWRGVRVNVSDAGLQRVDGVNLTLWRPRANPDAVLTGAALGVVGPEAREIRGIALGLGGVVAAERLDGLALGGLGVVSGGALRGAGVGGLGLVAQHGMSGIGLGGLGLVSQGELRGIGIGGLGTVTNGISGIAAAMLGVVSQGPLTGIGFAGGGLVTQGVTGAGLAGLAVISEGDARWLTVGGLATVVVGRATGISAGGLALVADGGATGLNLGGLAIVGSEPLTGINLSLGRVESGEAVRGATFGGYRVRAPRVEGISVSPVMHRTTDLTGFALGGYNEMLGTQRGLSIGIVNYARELRGVQVGLINYAGNNPAGLKVMPIVNVGW